MLIFSSIAGAESVSLNADKVIAFSEEQRWDQDRQWQKLLHFKNGSSQIDSADFFFSPLGKTNPREELRATIRAFLDDRNISLPDQKAQCRFPGRSLWLNRRLQATGYTLPVVSCDRYQHFQETILGKEKGVQSLSLVFSSYYLNNPSSAFGHTFLRINKAPSARDGRRYELLDYGVNYSASVDTDNALVYAVKGLFGMFPGKFTSMPYYFKVREYNNAESRDLWEYDLSLDSNATEMLVAHIWELGPAKIDYWYLTENCSYEMLALLEAADPKVDLVSQIDFSVIPADTVRMVWQAPGLVKSVHYRPSIRTQFENRLEQLSSEQKKQLDQLLTGTVVNESINTETLDTYIDYLDYQNFDAGKRKSEILLARSQRSDGDLELKKIPGDNEKPHLAHGSGRWGVGAGYSEHKYSMLYASHRFALHDRLDPQWGYPSYSHISILDTDFSYSSSYQEPDNKHLELENFSLFEVRSLSPYTRFEKNHSWQVKLGMERVKNENIAEQLAGVMRGGIGYTWQWRRWDFTAHLLGEINYAGELPEYNFWAGGGVWTEARYHINSFWQFSAELLYEYQTTFPSPDYWRGRLATQWSPDKQWGLRLVYHNFRFDQEVQLLSYFYY